MEPSTEERFDVGIVGGGPAGLAAALVLGRMRRQVILLDADDPANAPSEHVHGFFGHDRTSPLELRRIGREQLRPYESVVVRTVAVDAARSTRGGFSLLPGGMEIDTGALLLAVGARYEPPPVAGIAEVWARGAYHCPYCHGWEVRDRPLAAYGADAAGLALLLTSLSEDVVLLTDGAELEPADAERLGTAGVAVREQPVARLEAEDGWLRQVVFADGSTDERSGFFVQPRFARSPLPGQLGCELDESGAVITDEDGRTSVPGLFAAGDATAAKKAVILAAAAGSRAAYAINGDLARGVLPVTEPVGGRRQRVETVRRAHDALNSGDIEALLAECDPAFRLDMSDRALNPAVYEGHEGIRQFLAEVHEAWETFTWEPEEIVESGERVLCLIYSTGRGRGSGLELEHRAAMLWTVPGERAASLRFFRDRAAAREAAGLT